MNNKQDIPTKTKVDRPELFQIGWFGIESNCSWELMHDSKNEKQFKADIKEIASNYTKEIINEMENGRYSFPNFLSGIVMYLILYKGYRRPNTSAVSFGSFLGEMDENFKTNFIDDRGLKIINKYV